LQKCRAKIQYFPKQLQKYPILSIKASQFDLFSRIFKRLKTSQNTLFSYQITLKSTVS